MPEFPDTHSIPDVTVLAGTEKAILCLIDGEQHWIPQSQIDDDSAVWQKGDTGTLVISEWIAIQKGLLEE